MAEPTTLEPEPQNPQSTATQEPPDLLGLFGDPQETPQAQPPAPAAPQGKPWFSSSDFWKPPELTLRGAGEALLGAALPVMSIPAARRAVEGGVRDLAGLVTDETKIPRAFGENESVAGDFASGMLEALSFFVPSTAAIRATGAVPKVIKAAKLASYAEAAAGGAVADFLMSKQGAAFSTWLSQRDNEAAKWVGSFLASDEDDTQWERRLKGTLEGGVLGVAFDGVWQGLRGIKALLRGSKDAAEEAFDASAKALEQQRAQAETLSAMPAAEASAAADVGTPPPGTLEPTQAGSDVVPATPDDILGEIRGQEQPPVVEADGLSGRKRTEADSAQERMTTQLPENAPSPEGGNARQMPANAESEKVVAAASRWGGKVFTGINHGETYEKVVNAFPERPKLFNPEDGFVTNRGRFINRDEAAKLFREAAANEDQAIINTYGLGSEQLNKQSKAVSANAGTAASPGVPPLEIDDYRKLLPNGRKDLEDIVAAAEARAKDPAISALPGVPGASGSGGEAGRVAPTWLSSLEMLEGKFKKGDINTAWLSYNRSTRGAAEIHRVLERLVDDINPNDYVEGFSDNFARDRAKFSEMIGDYETAAQARQAEKLMDEARKKPELARRLAREHAIVRLYSSVVEGHSLEVVRLAKAAIENPGSVEAQAEALDALTFQLKIAAEARAARSEMGRGLNSLKSQIALSKDEVTLLREKVLRGEPITPLESFSMKAAEDPEPNFGQLLSDPEAFAEKIKQYGGVEKVLEALNLIADAGDTQLKDRLPKMVGDIARKVVDAPQFLEFPLEVFVNSLIAGPRTVSTVITQQIIQGLYFQPIRRYGAARFSQAAAKLVGSADQAAKFSASAVGARNTIAATNRLLRDSAMNVWRHYTNGEALQSIPALVLHALKTGETTFLDSTAASFARGGMAKNKLAYDPIRAYFDQRLKPMGFDPDGPLARSIYWMLTEKGINAGHAIRLHGRVLSAADELTKQVIGRAVIQGELEAQAALKFPGDPKAASEWANRRAEQALVNGKLRTKEVVTQQAREQAQTQGALNGWTKTQIAEEAKRLAEQRLNEDEALTQLVDYAAMQANEGAATTKPLPGTLTRRYSDAASAVPALRFFTPFITSASSNVSATLSPLNPFGYATFFLRMKRPVEERALHEVKSRMARELLSGDTRQQADAIGRLGTAITIGAIALYLASKKDELGLPSITGSGPRNKSVKKIYQDAGWKPNSIRVGNMYFETKRADPVGLLLGLYGSIADYSRYASDEDAGLIMGAMDATVTATSEMLRDRTYMQGLASALLVAVGQRSASDAAEDIGAGFIPNYIPQIGFGIEDAITGEPAYLRDARNAVDALERKLPWFREGAPIVRNVLGEPVPATEFFGPDMISWLAYSKVTSDPLKREFVMLQAPLSPPGYTQNGVKLTDITLPSGQNAFDRFQELAGTVRMGNGPTLRESLESMLSQSWYQQIDPNPDGDMPSARVGVIQGTIAMYRDMAFRQLLTESPEVAAQFQAKQAENVNRYKPVVPK